MERVRLTKTLVERSGKPGAETWIWDSDLPGFGLRVWPSGKRSFVAQYRVGGGRGGRQRRLTLGTYPTLTVEKARKAAGDALATAQLGGDAAKARDDARIADTVSDLCDLWLAEAAHLNRRTGAVRSAKNVAGERGRIDSHVRPLIGNKRLKELNRADIERFRDQVARGATKGQRATRVRGLARVRGGTGTAKRTVTLLSSVLGFGCDRGLIADNPVRGIRHAPGRVMQRFLSPDELGRLGAALEAMEGEGANPSALTIIRMLALTGARRGEISGLRWREVDFQRGLIRLEASKTGAKVFPLAPPALVILEALPRTAGSEFVFPAASGDSHFQGLGKVWTEARERAGLADVRLHDLRHTFASFGAAGGFGLPVIGALLGHRQAATTARYAHLADDPLKHAAGRIGGEIGAAMQRRVAR